MTQEQQIEELYERIAYYRTKLYEREDIEEVVRKYLLHSNMPIGEVASIMWMLNLPDNKQEYTPQFRESETELFRVLEMI